jgi:hypothetical protein
MARRNRFTNLRSIEPALESCARRMIDPESTPSTLHLCEERPQPALVATHEPTPRVLNSNGEEQDWHWQPPAFLWICRHVLALAGRGIAIAQLALFAQSRSLEERNGPTQLDHERTRH